jgi:hypothetical protein
MFKHLAVCTAFLFVVCTPPPQATEGDEMTSDVIDINMSKADIYNKTLQWIASAFVSSKHVIELKDRSQGVIVGNGITYVTWQLLSFEMHFTIRIDIKDQKYRFSSFNYVAYYDHVASNGMSKELANRTQEKINLLERSLNSYLAESMNANNF